MRIAIFHNYLDNIGGAEKVSLLFARELGADIYTTNIDAEKIHRMGFDTKNIFSIGHVPINAPLRQEATTYHFSRLSLGNRYDMYIIAGDWAIGAALHNRPIVWYVFSPARELWDLYEETRANTVPWYSRSIYDWWVRRHRKNNLSILSHIDGIIATSGTVQARIRSFFHQETPIIYPPIDASLYYNTGDHGYWLSVNRLIGHKRVDIQVEAFRQMPEKQLLIVGSYERSLHFRKYATQIMHSLPANVQVKSWVEDEELRELYAGCRGFITTSHDEDFGLTVLEAMASGKPVIASDEGGYQETVIEGTGIRITPITPEELMRAVRTISQDPVPFCIQSQQHAYHFDIAKVCTRLQDECIRHLIDHQKGRDGSHPE